MLFIGSYLGFIWAKFCNLTGLSENLPVSNFTLVGMAGILSGLFHAPLTALFLIAEITGGYSLMIPLMIVSSISYAISKRYETFSFDIKDLADKGDVFTNNKDKNILTTLSILDCIETDIKYVFESENLIELVEIAKQTSQSVFPDHHPACDRAVLPKLCYLLVRIWVLYGQNFATLQAYQKTYL